MAMDWLGAMFQGIGDTFKAGASVDTAKISAESANKQLSFNRDVLDADITESRAAAVIASNNAQRNTILGVLGIITLIIIVYIYKK